MDKVRVVGVVAVDSRWGIGNDEKLLSFPREDMLHFQETVKDGLLICSSNVFTQMKKSLGTFYVYSRRPVYWVTAKAACSNARYLLNRAKQDAKLTGKTVYLCGGKRLYSLLSNDVDEWIITQDTRDLNANVHFEGAQFLLEAQGKDWEREVIKELTPTCKVHKVKIR